jgi:hypothetical protein
MLQSQNKKTNKAGRNANFETRRWRMSTDKTALRETSEDAAHDLERRVLPGVDTGEILYKRRLLPGVDTRRWMEELSAKLPWKQLPITMFGKTVMQPRRICWLTDSADVKYRYSGLDMTPVVWTVRSVIAVCPDSHRTFPPLLISRSAWSEC